MGTKTLALKTGLKNAEVAKNFLKERKLILPGLALKKVGKSIYFPVGEKPTGKLPFAASFPKAVFQELEQPQDLKQTLAATGRFSGEDLDSLVTSFDTVGDIALLDIPESLASREKLIAQTVMRLNSHIKVVAKKKSAMKGEYRVRELEVIAGEKRTETIYKESGCSYKLDLSKVFFSPRLAFERLRVAKMVKPNKNALVLFAGVGPFAILIAKKQPLAQVVGVELNPAAIKYFNENIALNKMQGRVRAIEGDVNKIVPKQFANWADYIHMPAPHTATEFLDAALLAARKGCIITFYGFERTDGKDEPFVLGAEGKILVSPVRERVQEACKRNKRKCKIIFEREVRTYAPNVIQKAVDFQVLN
ncbi:MAG: class I SAM-dependent methyltransferase family protein [Candidatus Micrarchaeia archaeon]|jgi:tRNA (guanine37-N1)-methyltransferase